MCMYVQHLYQMYMIKCIMMVTLIRGDKRPGQCFTAALLINRHNVLIAAASHGCCSDKKMPILRRVYNRAHTIEIVHNKIHLQSKLKTKIKKVMTRNGMTSHDKY